MKVTYCDRCNALIGTLIDSYYCFHISYSGNNEADLCKDCAKEFQDWLNKDSKNEDNNV